jgi:hypothetical protein
VLEDRIPHSWIGSEVVLETGASYNYGGGIRATLQDVTAERISVSLTMYYDEGEREETAFYPWSSVYRLRRI